MTALSFEVRRARTLDYGHGILSDRRGARLLWFRNAPEQDAALFCCHAYAGKELVGVASFVIGVRTWTLCTIWTAPALRRRGVASAMLCIMAALVGGRARRAQAISSDGRSFLAAVR